MAVFFQVGALISFFQGIYDGDYSFADLAKQGNFGLGTLNGVDGEVIAIDGVFYRIDAHGVVSVVTPDALTPFAQVCHFKPMPPLVVENIENLQALNAFLDSQLPTLNIFYMLRIEGEFKQLHYRSEACQPRPYQPLNESLPKTQVEFHLAQSKGTLAVTRCPPYNTTLTVPGYHYHYLDDSKTTGGHIFDLQVVKARIQINPLRTFHMHLQETPEFDHLAMTLDIQDALNKIV